MPPFISIDGHHEKRTQGVVGRWRDGGAFMAHAPDLSHLPFRVTVHPSTAQ